ncbi:MAG: beta-lactamase family protein [Polyangiaceae bacterium]|nr:beta-lactamase family protein [Polyangiaceae bacterium]
MIKQRTELNTIAAWCVEHKNASPCAVVACAYSINDKWVIETGAAGELARPLPNTPTPNTPTQNASTNAPTTHAPLPKTTLSTTPPITGSARTQSFPPSPFSTESTPKPPNRKANTDTIFDLASLTKPFSCLTLARLVRHGLLDWKTQLSVPLQEALGTPMERTPLEWLASHRSGLAGHVPLYEPLTRGQPINKSLAIRQACQAARPECAENPRAQTQKHAIANIDEPPPVYSDLGYILLGEAMARASGMAIDSTIALEICNPLGIEIRSARQWRSQQLRAHDLSFDDRVAPTEYTDWRGGIVQGAVHDENAWAIGGDGACGHAGLFGRACDVAKLGVAILDACVGKLPNWLDEKDLEPLLRVRSGSTLRAGFDGVSSVGSSAGSRCSPATFGHLGFTGTSFWIDPDSRIVTVLLTNRVHPSRNSSAIKEVRPHAHDALFEWGTNHARVSR